MPSVVELQRDYVLVTSTKNFTLATNLQPTDVVVVIANRDKTTPMPIVSGLGGGWTQAYNAYVSYGLQVNYKTGVSGSGQIVTIQNLDTFNGYIRIAILVLRGLNQPILGGVESTLYPDLAPTESQPFSAGCIAIAIGLTQSSTTSVTFDTTPTTDWVQDEWGINPNPSVKPYMYIQHNIGLVPGEVIGKINVHGTGNALQTAVLVFGQPIIPVPFRGWGMPL